jgi:hypothetical protein
MNQKASYKFKVVDGIHKNSQLEFEADETCSVGSGMECDIILTDYGVKEDHLCIYFSNEEVNLIRKGHPIFIDGELLTEDKIILLPYQIVSIGEAHFAVGPVDLEWPSFKPVNFNNDPKKTLSTDLVPIDFLRESRSSNNLKEKIITKFSNVVGAISVIDKKVILGIFFFCIFSSFFWADFTNLQTNDSLFLQVNSKLNSISDKSLFMAGFKEPSIDVHSAVSDIIDPKQKVKDHLYKEWGSSLSEYKINLREIDFRGKNLANAINLYLKLMIDMDGIYSIEGYTQTREQRKAIISEIGDIVRTKIMASDDIKDLLEKTMQTKNFKNPTVDFDIEEKIITLRGNTSDITRISQIEDFITKMLPDIIIDNRIVFSPGDIDIIGASTGGSGFICLSDGSKVFNGGKLKNGCIIENISFNMVILNCNGIIVDYKLGKKS